jgi:hypothetical protein
MPRLPAPIFWILALAIALPVRAVSAAWSCPDGTPCVTDGHGYRCASDPCGAGSCCDELSGPRCRHGAIPGMAPPSAAGVSLSSPAHCRFAVTASPDAAAIRKATATYQLPAPDGLVPETGIQLPAAPAVLVRRADTFGYSPPLLLPAGPSRAPPTA